MHPVNTFFFFMCYHKGGNVYVSISLCVKSCVNRRIPSIVACQDWAGTSICNGVCVCLRACGQEMEATLSDATILLLLLNALFFSASTDRLIQSGKKKEGQRDGAK